jgi:energy-coupling factor transporter ATP-binding protein EcfA2
MFLRRIRIKNMRAISELDLSFESEGATDLDAVSGSQRELEGDARKWTLLLGENGCGKSTLLRAVALILSGSDALGELYKSPTVGFARVVTSVRSRSTSARKRTNTDTRPLCFHAEKG